MKLHLREIIDWLKADGAHQPPASGGQSGAAAIYPPPEECQLQASKAVHSLDITNKAYGLNLIPDDEYRRNLTHDLATFLANGNLRKVSLELIASNRTILAEQVIHFSNGAKAGKFGGVDGTVMPVVPKERVGDRRMMVYHHSSDHSAYRAHLKFNWTPGEELARQRGDSFECNQAKKTGGRQRDEVFVSASLREELVITNTGDRYGFCDVPARKLSGVFLHRKHVEGSRLPRVGEHWTGVLVQLPAGFQVRAVRPI
ncbi:MAG: hypothetical protein ABSF95_03860 [Verrucomicrobiota bacterium]|jgi:hypothetical protein